MWESMKINYEVLSVAGKIRSQNQDNYFANGFTKKMEDIEGYAAGISEQKYQIFAVCDGMGGEEAGEVAAALAIENLYHYIPESFENHWKDYISETNRIICEYQSTHQIQMGTTFAGLCITPYRVLSINIGDSRVYRIRDGRITQFSYDHNEYQTMLELGIILDENLMKKAKSRLTQCLGISEMHFHLEPYVAELDSVVEGDIYLLCSDGLYGVLSEEQIVKTILHCKKRKNYICEELIRIAERYGSRDNITAMVVCVGRNQHPFTKKRNIIKRFINS